jgi:hypothetical protein
LTDETSKPGFGGESWASSEAVVAAPQHTTSATAAEIERACDTTIANITHLWTGSNKPAAASLSTIETE